MQSLDDIALLREYAERGTEAAFATLVTRHIDRVYSVALRHTRNPHSAEEITQAVFVILARQSRQMRKGVILAGWLYQTARLTAITHIRSESRRARREQEAVMQTLTDENQSGVWSKITPLLDAALTDLSESDRNAVVLRFFYGRSMGEIGTALGASEDSARMRVNRALEKLHTYFSRRGVNSTAETIAGAISANCIQTAPLALAKTVTVAALTHGAAASTSTLTLIKGALKIMAWSKAQTAVVGVVIVGLATYSVIQHQTKSKLRGQNESLQQQVAQLSRLKVGNQNLSNQLAQANSSEVGTRSEPNNPEQQPPLEQPTNRVQAAATPPNAPVPQTADTASVELPKTSWTNAGFATPQAVLQSRGAAVLNGDRDLFKQSVFITDDARKFAEDTFVKMAEASNDPNKAQYIQGIVNNNLGVEEAILMPMMAANQNNSFTGYKIISQQSLSDNEMVLQVETDTVSASPQTETLDFQRFGGDWKIVYNQAAIQRMMQQ